MYYIMDFFVLPYECDIMLGYCASLADILYILYTSS